MDSEDEYSWVLPELHLHAVECNRESSLLEANTTVMLNELTIRLARGLGAGHDFNSDFIKVNPRPDWHRAAYRDEASGTKKTYTATGR